MLENVIAHDEETSIWSLCLIPDKVLLLLYYYHFNNLKLLNLINIKRVALSVEALIKQ